MSDTVRALVAEEKSLQAEIAPQAFNLKESAKLLNQCIFLLLKE